MTHYTELSPVDKSLVDAIWAARYEQQYHPDIHVIEAALKNGANPSVVFYDDSVTSNGRITPLAHALLSNNHPLFSLLLDHGADILSESDLNGPSGSKPDLRIILDKIGNFYGADRSYLDEVLAKMNVGTADTGEVNKLVASIKSDVAKRYETISGDAIDALKANMMASFKKLRDLGVVFGGSKRVVEPQQVVAQAPIVAAAPASQAVHIDDAQVTPLQPGGKQVGL